MFKMINIILIICLLVKYIFDSINCVYYYQSDNYHFRSFKILLINEMKQDVEPEALCESGMIGIGWASSGGESTAVFNEGYLAADGIENVNRVLDAIENGNIPPLKFIELNACTGGCVGGAMTMENPFIAKARLHSLKRYLPVSQNFLTKEEKKYIPESYFFNDLPMYNPISRLSDNMAQSMRMMADIQKLRKALPGIDCGACGAPTCRAFAEDVVKKLACPDDCHIMKVMASKEDKEEQ